MSIPSHVINSISSDKAQINAIEENRAKSKHKMEIRSIKLTIPFFLEKGQLLYV